MSRKKNKNNSGQLLLESAIAITVLIVGLLGILGLLARSFSLNKIVTSRYTAAYLAAEGIEVVKNLIDKNVVLGAGWNNGLGEDGYYEISYDFNEGVYRLSIDKKPEENKWTDFQFLCFDAQGQDRLFNYDSACYTSPPTKQKSLFKRAVRIKNISDINAVSNQIQVNSMVFWKIGGIDYLVDAEDHFFNIIGQAQQ